MQTESDLTWTQLHSFSSMLLLESPEKTLSDGLCLLELLQELGQGRDRYGKTLLGSEISTERFLNAMKISEGLIRMGIEMNNHKEVKHVHN